MSKSYRFAKAVGYRERSKTCRAQLPRPLKRVVNRAARHQPIDLAPHAMFFSGARMTFLGDQTEPFVPGEDGVWIGCRPEQVFPDDAWLNEILAFSDPNLDWWRDFEDFDPFED